GAAGAAALLDAGAGVGAAAAGDAGAGAGAGATAGGVADGAEPVVAGASTSSPSAASICTSAGNACGSDDSAVTISGANLLLVTVHNSSNPNNKIKPVQIKPALGKARWETLSGSS
ncbi:MAG: hypothetical protein ACK55Z_31240, partial [bacterium]